MESIRANKAKFIALCLLIFINVLSTIYLATYAFLTTLNGATQFFDVILFITIFLNIGMAFAVGTRLGIWHLIFTIIVTFGVMLFNIVFAKLISGVGLRNAISVILLLSLFLAGTGHCVLILIGKATKPAKEKYTAKSAKIIFAVMLVVLFALTVIAYDITFNKGYSLTEYIFQTMHIFLSIMTFALALLAVRFAVIIADGKGYYYFTVMAITIVMGVSSTIMFALPLFANPSVVNAAKDEYIEAFGDSAFNRNDYSKKYAFSLTDLLIGINISKVQSKFNVEYYKDGNKNLMYDVYYSEKKPTKAPVLVRIHGGGNNKGITNNIEYNKYFASIGYVVYDIQIGNETIDTVEVKLFDDYIVNIGRFFAYAKDNSQDLNADFNNSFITGSSFGGGVSISAGILLSNSGYENALPEGVKLKGIIPTVTALYNYSYIGDDTQGYLWPSYIDVNTPPMLIFSATHDGVADPYNAYLAKQILTLKGKKSAVIDMKYGRHGIDMHFPNENVQLLLYLTERFITQFSV